MSRRTERLSSLIRRIVADEIQSGLADPRIAPMTSVTRVEVSADLSFAKVYVSAMASEKAERLSVEALQHATGHIQTALAGQLSLRRCPRIQFVRDESLKKSFQVIQMIEREMAALDSRPRAADRSAEAPRAAEEAE